MPIIDDIDISFEAGELEKLPGLQCRSKISKRMSAMVSEIIADITQDNLIHPSFTYGIVPVQSMHRGTIELEQGTRLYAPLLAHRLERATSLAFGVATIGNAISETIDQLFQAGKQFKAILMEEIANAYLYKVSMQLQHQVEEAAGTQDLQTSGTLAPGDDGFDLDEQDRVLALAGAAGINVSLSESFMMTPRHSISNVIGIGQRMPSWTQLENCSLCAARDRCRHQHSIKALSP